MLMPRSEIEKLIPHKGLLCLLDAVLSWSEKDIHCKTASHSRADNPFLVEDRLHSAILIEYAAQAAAIHSALLKTGLDDILDGNADKPAYIGGVKNLRLFSTAIDPDVEALEVRVSSEMQSLSGAIYQAEVSAGSDQVMSAQIALIKH